MIQDNSMSSPKAQSNEMAMSELLKIEREQLQMIKDMKGQGEEKQLAEKINQSPANTKINTIPSNKGNTSALFTSNAIQGSNNGINTGGSVSYMPPTFRGEARQSQFSEYINSLKANGELGRAGFFGSIMPQGTKTSTMTSDLLGMDYSARLAQTGVSGIGAASGVAASTAAMALGGGLFGGMLLGAGAGLGVGMYADAAVDEMQQQSSYKKYLYKNSYKFINNDESNNDRSLSGFSMDESRKAASFMRGMAEENFIEDEEAMMLLQKFTEGGLLKDSRDLESFKKQMSSLTKYVKTSAIILNQTYDEIADTMSTYKKLGMDMENFNDYASGIKITAATIGVDSSKLEDVVANIIANLTVNTPNDADNTATRVEDTMLYMSSIYEKLGEVKNMTPAQENMYNSIKNFGGVQGASKEVMELMESSIGKKVFTDAAMGMFNYDSATESFIFDRNVYEQYTSGYMNYDDMMALSSQKAERWREEGHAAAVSTFDVMGSTYLKNNLNDGQMAQLMHSTIQGMQNSTSLKTAGFSEMDVIHNILGIKDPGQSTLLAGYLDYRDLAGNELSYQHSRRKLWTEITAEKQVENPTFTEHVKSALGKFKEDITSPFTKMQDNLDDWFVGFQDKLRGFKPVRWDDEFKISTLDNGFGASAMKEKSDEIIRKLASTAEELGKLAELGIVEKDDELLKTANLALGKMTEHIDYQREIITDWSAVSKDLSALKETIVSESQEHNLSETILGALMKYENTTNKKQITADEIKVIASDLGENIKKYGGNNKLALASYFGGGEKVDAQLKHLGYDVNNLNSKNQQELLLDVNIKDLNLPKEITDKIEQALNINIGTGKDIIIPGSNPNTDNGSHTNDQLNYDGYAGAKNTKKLIKLAADRFDISEEYLAALSWTENDSGNNSAKGRLVNGEQARGVMQVMTPAAKAVQKNSDPVSLTTGDKWDGTLDHFNRDIGLNIAYGSAYYKQQIDAANGNDFLGYAMYSHGQSGFQKVLDRAGLSVDQASKMSDTELLAAIKRVNIGDSYATMDRYHKKIMSLTNDGKNTTKHESKDGVAPTEDIKKTIPSNVPTKFVSAYEEYNKGVDEPTNLEMGISSTRSFYNRLSSDRSEIVEENIGFSRAVNTLINTDINTIKKSVREDLLLAAGKDFTVAKEQASAIIKDPANEEAKKYASNALDEIKKAERKDQGLFEWAINGLSDSASKIISPMISPVRPLLNGVPGSRTQDGTVEAWKFFNSSTGRAAKEYFNYLAESGSTAEDLLARDSEAVDLREKMLKKLERENPEGDYTGFVKDAETAMDMINFNDRFSKKHMIAEMYASDEDINIKDYDNNYTKMYKGVFDTMSKDYHDTKYLMNLTASENSNGVNRSDESASWRDKSLLEKASEVAKMQSIGEGLSDKEKNNRKLEVNTKELVGLHRTTDIDDIVVAARTGDVDYLKEKLASEKKIYEKGDHYNNETKKSAESTIAYLEELIQNVGKRNLPPNGPEESVENNFIRSLSKDEQELIQHLHKDDATGKMYYDADKKSNGKASYKEVVQWYEDGQDSRGTLDSKIKTQTELTELMGMDLGNLTISDGIKKADELYDKVKAETAEAGSLLSGITASDFKDSKAGALIEQAIQENNLADVKKIKETMKADGASAADLEKVDKVIKSLDMLNSNVNPDTFLKMVEAFDIIQGKAKDIAQISEMVGNTLGESFRIEYESEAIKGSSDILRSSSGEGEQRLLEEIRKNMTDKDKQMDLILDALYSGGEMQLADGTTIHLTADTLDKMANLLGATLSEKIKEGLLEDTNANDDEGLISQLMGDTAMINKLGETLGKTPQGIEELLTAIASSNALIEKYTASSEEEKKEIVEEYGADIETLIEDRDKSIETIVSAYEKAMTASEKVTKDSTTTANDFVTKLSSYDEAFKKAIGVLEGRIQSGFLTQKTKYTQGPNGMGSNNG